MFQGIVACVAHSAWIRPWWGHGVCLSDPKWEADGDGITASSENLLLVPVE